MGCIGKRIWDFDTLNVIVSTRTDEKRDQVLKSAMWDQCCISSKNEKRFINTDINNYSFCGKLKKSFLKVVNLRKKNKTSKRKQQ